MIEPLVKALHTATDGEVAAFTEPRIIASSDAIKHRLFSFYDAAFIACPQPKASNLLDDENDMATVLSELNISLLKIGIHVSKKRAADEKAGKIELQAEVANIKQLGIFDIPENQVEICIVIQQGLIVVRC